MKNIPAFRLNFFICAAIVAVLVIIASPFVPGYGADAEWYISIAKGHIEQVIKPFSSRFLAPFLAGEVSGHFGLDLGQAFLLIALLSLILFLFTNVFFFKKLFPSPLLIFPVFLLPYLALITQAFFLPDLFYLFLSAVFFLFLMYGVEAAALVFLFLLFLTRESTVLLSVVWLAVSIWKKNKFLSAAILLVMLVSIVLTQQIGNLGMPNVHDLGNLSYLVLKVPYNLFTNIFGAKLWVNTLSGNCVPVVTLKLPSALPLGAIHEVGFCGFDLTLPLHSAIALLTVFGTLPLLLWRAVRRKFKLVLGKTPLWLLVALGYGLLCYVGSVFATGALEKFIGYGWPAFLLATPFLVYTFMPISAKTLVKLSLVHLSVAWLPVLVPLLGISGMSAFLIVLPLVLAGYWYTSGLLRGAGGTVPV